MKKYDFECAICAAAERCRNAMWNAAAHGGNPSYAVRVAALRAVASLPPRWRRAVRLTIICALDGDKWPVLFEAPDGRSIKRAFARRLAHWANYAI